MADVRPFRGLRFDPSRVADVGQVVCPPYDVINEEDERRYLDRHPNNAVRVELSTASAGSSDASRYERAARTLGEWRNAGVLVHDTEPGIYLHEASFIYGGGTSVRRELIVAVGLEPWDRGVVLPHERTYDRPKADRLRLLEATRTNVSPILSFFQRGGDADDAVTEAWSWADTQPAVVEGTDLADVGHRLWVLQDKGLLERLQAFFVDRRLFIADGHHRYETALYYRDRRREASAGRLADDGPAGAVMMHLIADDDPGLVILPIHRLLRGLGDLDAGELETRISGEFHAEYYPLWPDAPAEQVDAYVTQLQLQGQADRTIGVYGPDPEIFAVLSLRNKRALPSSIPADRDPSWQALDVVLADESLIRPLLAERGLAAEDVMDYTRDAHDAFRLVRSGERHLAVLLNATRVDQIAAVALAGERMPEKSTYFYPKAPTGLVFRPLE